MKKFEYLVLSKNNATDSEGSILEEKFDSLGQKGWELITFVGYQFVFKREKEQK